MINAYKQFCQKKTSERLFFSFLLMICLTVFNDASAEKQPADEAGLVVHFIRPEGHINNDYVSSLLKLALDKSRVNYILEPLDIEVEQGREINAMKRVKGAVITCGTSKKFETAMRPIRIPIYRGMLGYRIGIISKARQPEFSAINSLNDYRKMSIGQGIGWSDTAILESAGFHVITADYQQLFKMVARNRFDCFLRGINEAFDEVAAYGKDNPEIAVETDLVLYYPFAMFFFVNKEDGKLADAIETGLNRAYDDGSFIDFFNTHPQTKSVLEKANLGKRKIFKIENHTLSLQTQSIPERYWFIANTETIKE